MNRSSRNNLAVEARTVIGYAGETVLAIGGMVAMAASVATDKIRSEKPKEWYAKEKKR